MPEIYTCAAGDTYESIASNLYGDATLAGYIDVANGGGVLIAGQTLLIPPLMSVHNKASMARPYYQFLQIMQGSLMPHLDTPQPPQDDDDGFFGFLFKAVVIAVICVAVPELAPELVSGIAAILGVSETVVTVVGVGLVDAAAQGLCIGLGIQDHFSLAELATTMITVGFGSQLGPLSAEFTSAELMEYIVKAGLVNVEEQLAEMAIGIRHQFDLAGVALAMGSAGLSSEIKIANPLERSIVADLSVAAMGGVVRGRIDVENLAIQLISDSARYGVQQSYANSSSEEYHQSQRASRGEGPITQTTIEQQWESQLINDAEFTANRQLPSVTFDVNNSYVAEQLGQRVGEEVSHFYHPTPPPRNPSGFWRGVDDVLKMQEGTRKFADLFFTGHYEAPRDSWERAGFVIGAPIALSLGAERLGAEAINTLYQGSQQLGKGLMQASRLMNRWGLFGHNGVESSIFGARGVVSGRAFDEAAAGGELRDLVGTQSRIKFTHQGVDVVKAHTSRFGADAANQYMINRLRAIANGEIPATTIDRNFYSHELREFVRYRRLGWGSGVPKSLEEREFLWNNTHTATLEEYGLSGSSEELYHPEALTLANQQLEEEFLNSLKFHLGY